MPCLPLERSPSDEAEALGQLGQCYNRHDSPPRLVSLTVYINTFSTLMSS